MIITSNRNVFKITGSLKAVYDYIDDVTFQLNPFRE